MIRYERTDLEWEFLVPLLPPTHKRGHSCTACRTILNDILLQQFRRVAMRYGKQTNTRPAFITFTSVLIGLRFIVGCTPAFCADLPLYESSSMLISYPAHNKLGGRVNTSEPHPARDRRGRAFLAFTDWTRFERTPGDAPNTTVLTLPVINAHLPPTK